jgi:hypothetical protein
VSRVKSNLDLTSHREEDQSLMFLAVTASHANEVLKHI